MVDRNFRKLHHQGQIALRTWGGARVRDGVFTGNHTLPTQVQLHPPHPLGHCSTEACSPSKHLHSLLEAFILSAL